MSVAHSSSASESESSNFLFKCLYLLFLLMLMLDGLVFGWVKVQRSRREFDLQEAKRIQAQLVTVNQQLHREWTSLTSPQKNRLFYRQKLGLVPAERVVILEEIKM